MSDFPDGFLWGSATAAHQVEGGNVNNDWWQWEHTPGTSAVESSGDGIDHLHRYEEDFALLASLGQNAHRFSLEWSRIEPAPGEFSQAAIDHYARVLESLHRNGLTPFATLYHFTLPRWFAEQGGWQGPDALDVFGRYVSVVAERLGDLIPYACTINEPQIVSLVGHAIGEFPPGHRDFAEAAEVNRTLIAAHRTAVAAMRAGRGSAKLGTCLSMAPVEPLRPGDEKDEAAVALLRNHMQDSHLEDLRAGGDVGDWVGLQYYTRLVVDAEVALSLRSPSDARLTQMGWEVYPEGFGRQLRAIATAGLPVVVTENGIATDDDAWRIEYLDLHLTELAAAVKDGVDVRGYLHWSSFDNFEWAKGYAPTFGLIGIDRENGFARVVRPSAEAYGRVARTGRVAALLETP